MEFLEQLFNEHPKLKLMIQIVTTIVGIFVIFCIFYILSYKVRADLSRKQDVLNFINDTKYDNISTFTIRELEKYKNTNILEDEYNITPVIIDYYSKIETAVNYIGRGYKGQAFQETIRSDELDTSIGYSYMNEDITFLLDIIPMNQFDEFQMNGKSVIEYLTKELEKKFTHKSDNFTKEWYVNKDQLEKFGKLVKENQYEINLPFTCVINILLPKVNKIERKYTDVSLINEGKTIRAILIGDDKQKYETSIKFEDDRFMHNYDMTIGILGILYKYNKGQIVLYSPYSVEG